MSGMQASRTSTKTNNSFFSRDKKKKVVKNTTSCPGFLVFFFPPREEAGSQNSSKEHYYPSPILENDLLIIDKWTKRKFLLQCPWNRQILSSRCSGLYEPGEILSTQFVLHAQHTSHPWVVPSPRSSFWRIADVYRVSGALKQGWMERNTQWTSGIAVQCCGWI